MIHEPAKWAGWQSTTAAAQHLERLKQMQDQIYKILSSRSGKPLRQIIRDTKRTDFYLDAQSALDYGLIDGIVAGELPEPKPVGRGAPTRGDGRRRRVKRKRRRERTQRRPRAGAGMLAADTPACSRRLTRTSLAFRDARHSSSRRAALPATECSVGVQPSARARGLRTT